MSPLLLKLFLNYLKPQRPLCAHPSHSAYPQPAGVFPVCPGMVDQPCPENPAHFTIQRATTTLSQRGLNSSPGEGEFPTVPSLGTLTQPKVLCLEVSLYTFPVMAPIYLGVVDTLTFSFSCCVFLFSVES